MSINSRTNDTTHQPLVTDLLKIRITELEKQVADKKLCHRVPDKKHAK